jgi:hypothetical protein
MAMRTFKALFVLTTFLMLSAVTPSQAQTVLNPSFEAVQIGSPFFSSNLANIPNWTHTGVLGDGPLWHVGYADGGGSITVAGDGNQFVTMGGGGGVGTAAFQQVVSGFTPGQTYTLSFMMASESTPISQSITVDFPTGSPTAPLVFSAAVAPANYWRGWETKTMNFLANNSSVTLEFTATTAQDVGLDNVSVKLAVIPTPEPGALSLLAGLGLSGAGLALRARRQKAEGRRQ